jgi:hypothetical protein
VGCRADGRQRYAPVYAPDYEFLIIGGNSLKPAVPGSGAAGFFLGFYNKHMRCFQQLSGTLPASSYFVYGGDEK